MILRGVNFDVSKADTNESFEALILPLKPSKHFFLFVLNSHFLYTPTHIQAKKFVEGVPQVIKADVSKEEAEKLKTALEAVGGSVELD